MNPCVARVIFEKQSADPSSTEGVYADYSKGADSPEFYVECPKCGVVDGMYPDLKTAVAHRVCGTCEHEKIEKAKRDLEKVNDRPNLKPGQKRKLPWPLSVKEALVSHLLEDGEPPAAPDPDEDDIGDPKQEISRMLPVKTYTLGGNSMIHAPGLLRMAQSEWRNGRKKQKTWAMNVVKAWQGLPEEVYTSILNGNVDIETKGDDAVVTIRDWEEPQQRRKIR